VYSFTVTELSDSISKTAASLNPPGYTGIMRLIALICSSLQTELLTRNLY